jgi:hypothetical protein
MLPPVTSILAGSAKSAVPLIGYRLACWFGELVSGTTTLFWPEPQVWKNASPALGDLTESVSDWLYPVGFPGALDLYGLTVHTEMVQG